MDVLTFDNEGTMFVRSTRNHSPNNTASHLRRLDLYTKALLGVLSYTLSHPSIAHSSVFVIQGIPQKVFQPWNAMLQLSIVSQYSTGTWTLPEVQTELISHTRQMIFQCPASSMSLWVSYSGSISHCSQDLPGPVQRQLVLVPLSHTAWNLSSWVHSLTMRCVVRNQSHTLPSRGKEPQPLAQPHTHSVDRLLDCIN